MRRLCLASIALVAAAFSGPARAADMPVYKAPPAAAYSWTGFYLGANLGYSAGRAGNDWNFFAPNRSGSPTATVCSTFAGGGGAICANGSDSNKLSGVLGGLQAGYNWQAGNVLLGIEADFQSSGQRGSRTFTTNFEFLAFPLPVPGTIAAPYSEKLTSLGTLRGRVGFAADRWLVYATGGLAYGQVAIDGSATATSTAGSPGCAPGGPGGTSLCPLAAWSNTAVKAGWTIGAGIEGALTNHWSVKVEYLHVDLGKAGITFATLPGCYGVIAACLFAAAGTGTITSRITDEIVRVGVNYKLGGGV
jgi:outer membrane immunogenic protein